ncbi:ATP-binding protein [Terrimonas sp. NA20]|uniref:histidine kinase n=1 Tax=Terrimonas ginsenosidimutans TaxID=2908004 RepID=A0ABS9KJZ5_9BACT|nr:hybrid sensor histidine kinase/response regulator transcription factor [Terrimonas ginsenosidimutans]MCG2612642.1 ATP-binding protein [Terrimonas ginsenosidimutans]
MFRTLLILFATFNAMFLAAQQLMPSNQQRFKTEDGLPQSFVSGIVQDKSGFIWIGTQDGLARFDGRSFKSFSSANTKGTDFRSYVINDLVINKDDHLSLFYQGGTVDDFDPVSFTVRPVTGGKRNLPPIKQGIVAGNTSDNLLNFMYRINGDGLHWTEPSTGEKFQAGTRNGKLQNDTIITVTKDRQGNLLVVTPSGIDLSRNSGKTFEHTSFRIPYDSTPLQHKIVVVLPDNTIVIRNKGMLSLINKETRSVSWIDPGTKESYNSTSFNFVKLDHQDRLYFESYGHIFRREHDGRLHLLWKNPFRMNITAFLIDRDDVLWVSPNAEGLYKVTLQPGLFKSYEYEKGFFPDAMKLAGLPVEQLPSSWFPRKEHFFFYTAFGPDSTQYMCYGDQDTIFKNPNLFYVDHKQLRALPFPSRTGAILRGLTISDSGDIWTVDPRRGGFWHWQNRSVQPDFIPVDSSGNSPLKQLADIKVAKYKIWISTYWKGLFVFENGKMVHVGKNPGDTNKLPDNLTDICLNPTNPSQLWIGSRGAGLILYDEKKGVRKIFTTEDGLSNNTVYSIVSDHSGILWLSTNKGICRFNPTDFSITSYVKSDGIAGNEFNRLHKLVFNDGRIALGGLEGFSVFRPSSFNNKKEPLAVPVEVTGISINNISQDFLKQQSFVKSPLTELKKLELPYNRNYIAVEFSALQFTEPSKIQYRYMLKGVDNSWRESGNNNIASYAQLRPGSYKLLINATGQNGVWSNNVKELDIIIRPPFWATWWAYALYAIAAFSIFTLYLRHHRKRTKEQEQLVFKQKETEHLKELDKLKDQFFSNITHEFRTPLTLIITPLEKLSQDQSMSPQAGQTLISMQRNAKKLLRLVNEFLDFSKLNKGQMKVSLSHGDFNLFVESIVQQFQDAAKEKNINLNYASSISNTIHAFDEEKWEKILFNLLSNALKFTDHGGKVNVSLRSLKDQDIELSVSDNGIGIDPGNLSLIFERFYQADSSDTRHYEGTGIGLALVNELTWLMKGSVRAESTKGKGSSFIVVCPLETVAAETAREVAIDERLAQEDNEPLRNLHEKPLILVAEDNAELRHLLAEGFTTDWQVITAADGLIAHEIILSEMPDVIISDIMMPGKNGMDLCRIVKEDQRTGHIGFILLTSRAAHDVKLKGLETGADDYVIKPFHFDELQLRISNLLLLQQKQREFLRLQALPADPGIALPKITDAFIQHVYQLLDAHLDDPQLNVDFLARNLSMSRSSLNRKLKSLLDISANDLIRRYRLQRATALLASGNDISSTAYQTGFNTPSYFSQCFREQYGITPSEYIASLNGR